MSNFPPDPAVLSSPEALDLVDRALAEDVGRGDWTTEALVAPDRQARARIVARAPIVVAGLPLAAAVFGKLDRRIAVQPGSPEGGELGTGGVLLDLSGPARAILTGERTALNLLARMCGIATTTARTVRAVAGTGVEILDTRKTTPGLRRLEKYAVACGGGTNHRIGLFDAVLIKDNHRILFAGEFSFEEAIARARRTAPPGTPVELEVDTLEEFDRALVAGADTILLDNFTPEQAVEAVRRRAARPGPRVRLEASGGIRPDTVRAWAEAGVDAISLGWLTHSAPAADLSMEFEP